MAFKDTILTFEDNKITFAIGSPVTVILEYDEPTIGEGQYGPWRKNIRSW